jgi:hypothetical protein
MRPVRSEAKGHASDGALSSQAEVYAQDEDVPDDTANPLFPVGGA